MCIYLKKKKKCILFYRFWGWCISGHRNESKNGEGLQFVLSFCPSLLRYNQRWKKIHTEPRLSKRDWGKDSEENRREGIKWAQVSNKKKAWHGFLGRFSLLSVRLFLLFSAGRCVWCSAIFTWKQWLFQDSLIRRLFLSLKAKSIQ